MSSNKLLVSSVAALSIMFTGAVAAESTVHIHIYGDDTPDTTGVPSPVSDPAKQRKTERMIREQERQAKKEYPKPHITSPTPDMEAQQRTERMIRRQEAQAKDEPR